MAGLSETGFEIKTYSDILSDQRTKATEYFGSGVDTTVNSILGQIVQLSAIEMTELWQGLQDVYDAFNVNAATGKSLDDLCSLVGVYRVDASATSGTMEFTGDNGTSISAGTVVSNPDTGDQFQVISDTVISTDSAYSITYQIKSVEDDTTYTLTLNGASTSYTTGTSAEIVDLRDGLLDALQTNSDNDDLSFESLDDDKIVITHGTIGNSFSAYPNASSISPYSVTSLVYVECTELGSVSADTGSITEIETPISGLDSVTNLTSLITGDDEETDDELRARRKAQASLTGKATPDAIVSALEDVQGVTSAFVVENRTMTTDSEGRPRKSYEAIVIGGEVSDIAETIWDAGPAGIQTYGDISQTVTDSNGDTQTVYFSRPENVYVHFEVEYEVYDEEEFPDDGVQGIKDAIVDYGDDSRNIGEDIIPQRFFGNIYSNVSGIQNLTIRVGSTSSPYDTPTSYSTDPLEISSKQLPDFSDDRISVTQV